MWHSNDSDALASKPRQPHDIFLYLIERPVHSLLHHEPFSLNLAGSLMILCDNASFVDSRPVLMAFNGNHSLLQCRRNPGTVPSVWIKLASWIFSNKRLPCSSVLIHGILMLAFLRRRIGKQAVQSLNGIAFHPFLRASYYVGSENELINLTTSSSLCGRHAAHVTRAVVNIFQYQLLSIAAVTRYEGWSKTRFMYINNRVLQRYLFVSMSARLRRHGHFLLLPFLQRMTSDQIYTTFEKTDV